jgi:peptide/nickel transport system substrate-binding protein
VPYDPEQARRLLDEAGWRDIDGDGIREREGDEFHFTAITASDYQTEAIYVQEQLRKVGIRMEIKILEYMLSIRTRRTGDFEASIHWGRRHNMAYGFTGKDSPIGYNNQLIEQLIKTAKNTFDPDLKDNLYREIWPIFQRDLPVTFLYPNIFGTCVAHKRIRGLSTPHRADPILSMEHLWIEEEK